MTDRAYYRNRGAGFTREDGTRVERGQVFQPTDFELRRLAHKLRPYTGTIPPEDFPAPRPRVPATPVNPEGWSLSMTPELYLELEPEGHHAAEARKLLGLEDADPEPAAAVEEKGNGDEDD